jgi:anti-sigma B factor antagonist
VENQERGGLDGAGLREDPVSAVDRDGSAVVVRLAGELDLYNAPALRSALLEAASDGAALLVVDLEGVRFIDSTALGVLVEARARIGADAFALAAPPLETRRALEISGLDRHFAVHGTVAEALTAR